MKRTPTSSSAPAPPARIVSQVYTLMKIALGYDGAPEQPVAAAAAAAAAAEPAAASDATSAAVDADVIVEGKGGDPWGSSSGAKQ